MPGDGPSHVMVRPATAKIKQPRFLSQTKPN